MNLLDMEWRKCCFRGNEQGKKEEEKALDIIVERIGCRLVILGQSFSLFIKTGMDRHHHANTNMRKAGINVSVTDNKEGTGVAQKRFPVIERFFCLGGAFLRRVLFLHLFV